MSFATLPSVIAQIEAGELKALAVASRSARRAAAERPDACRGSASPASRPTPGSRCSRRRRRRQAAIERLYGAVAAALDAPTPRATAIAQQGMTLALRPPAEVAAWLPGEVEKWAAVIKAAGVVAE